MGDTLPYWPRALREPLAAAYVGLSGSTFRQVVVPAVPAVRLTTGRVAWLREDLDAWLDKLKPPALDSHRLAADAPHPEIPNVRDAIAAGLAALSSKRRARGSRAAG
ncbi:helix-turn-helix transcriptional regulator [Roseococcus pinisoli]|uniref:DNA-binding protein n=1 Tax=Roseococcus pinisoli TaxID=2835040 RepID=A0ABS5QC17_9PROT|nr:hypothetical protein [Roseococcus pinisoli]MBS7810500.1 hypothetical protein [Roseococcus pinisoli]